jgi:hypothetical protein
MTEEDEAFNEIERRSVAKKDAVKAQLDKPQRTWVGLTDDERYDIRASFVWQFLETSEFAEQVQLATEAKLKEKNT